MKTFVSHLGAPGNLISQPPKVNITEKLNMQDRYAVLL